MNKPFFVLGIPKSGTTFLQRMLNMHPDISCPSEQSLGYLSGGLSELLAKYEAVVRSVDRRTGGQGIPIFDHHLHDSAFGALVSALAKSFAGQKPIFGLKENSIIGKVEQFDRIFHRPKIVMIFRDPVDTATSAWHHNHRLALEEPENANSHLAQIQNPDGGLDGYIKQFANSYRSIMDTFLNYSERRPNFLTVRYETLVSSKKEELRKAFRFLGAEASSTTIRDIIALSTPEQMAKASSNPTFFRPMTKARDGDHASAEVASQVRRQLRKQLLRLGYEQPRA